MSRAYGDFERARKYACESVGCDPARIDTFLKSRESEVRSILDKHRGLVQKVADDMESWFKTKAAEDNYFYSSSRAKGILLENEVRLTNPTP